MASTATSASSRMKCALFPKPPPMSGATTLILASLSPVMSEITVRNVCGTCVDTYISRRPVDGSNSPRAPWPSIGRPLIR